MRSPLKKKKEGIQKSSRAMARQVTSNKKTEKAKKQFATRRGSLEISGEKGKKDYLSQERKKGS